MLLDAITKKSLLLVEGLDDHTIVCHLLNKINSDWKQLIDVQYSGGGSNLPTAVQAIQLVSGFNQVRQLAVLADADESAEKTNQTWSKEKVLFESKFSTKKFNYFILPSSDTKGALETVFLQSLQPDDAKHQCVTQFMACLSGQTPHTTQAQKDKLALISYINTSVKTPYSRVGMALQQKAKDLFDFNHPAFQPLIHFLESLF